jgi:hypothetical protein
MAKPATYEPLVIAELKRHPEGMTRRELREKVGCSSQQIHKIVEKGKLPKGHRQYRPIEVVGKGDFGSDIVRWMGEVDESIVPVPVEGTRHEAGMVPVGGQLLGQHLKVVAVTIEGDVTVETDDGRRLNLHR